MTNFLAIESMPMVLLLSLASTKSRLAAQEGTELILDKLVDELELTSGHGIITSDPETNKIYKIHSRSTLTYSSGRKMLTNVPYELLKDNPLFAKVVSAMEYEVNVFNTHNDLIKSLVSVIMTQSINTPEKLELFQKWMMQPLLKYSSILKEYDLYDFVSSLMVQESDLDETFSEHINLKSEYINHVENLFGMDLLFDF